MQVIQSPLKPFSGFSSQDSKLWWSHLNTYTVSVDAPAGSGLGEVGSVPWDCDPIFAVSYLPATLSHKYGLKHVYQFSRPFGPQIIEDIVLNL